MPLPALIALIVGAWVVVAVVVALIIGRTAAAGEQERELDAMRREARHADASKRSTDGPATTEISTRPRS